MTERPVVVLGDANVDLSFRRVDESRATNAGVEMERGGAAANTAVALARQSAPVAFLGMLGDDALGRFIRQDLEAEGVDVSSLRTHPVASSQQVIYALDADGGIWNNAVWPSLKDCALFQLDADAVDLPLIVRSGWVHIQGFCLSAVPIRDATLAVVRVATDAGVPLSIDVNLRGMESTTSDFREVIEVVLPHARVVLGSASDEFAVLYPDLTAVEAAERIAGSTDATIVVRMASEGAMAITGSVRHRAAPFPANVRNAVGAGDALTRGTSRLCSLGRTSNRLRAVATRLQRCSNLTTAVTYDPQSRSSLRCQRR